MNPVKLLLKTLLFFHLVRISISINDIIGANQLIKDGDVIVSIKKIFALGFFSPGNSVKRYVGIWYHQIPEQTVVWVANRDNPIRDKSGALSINSDGNLVLHESNQTVPVWQTNISGMPEHKTIAQLLDSGNLVLVRHDTRKMLWQSFDHPTDTMLPKMKIGLDKRTGCNKFLTSWKSPDDPGTGSCSFKIDPTGFPQLFIYKDGAKWWRTGSWTGEKWSGVPEMARGYIFNSTFISNEDEVSISFGVADPSIISKIMVNESGNEQLFTWSEPDHRWIGFFSPPKEPCDYYGHCGSNSYCNPNHTYEFECTCLPGFVPKYRREWFLRDGSGGCKRKPWMSTCQNGEGFVRVTRAKVPDTSFACVDMSLGLKACKDKCLRNCSCLAYTSAYAESNGGTGCLTYHEDMMDTRTYTSAGQDLYIRVDAAELALYAKNGSPCKKKIIAMVTVSSVVMLLMVILVCWLFRRKRLMDRARNSRFSSSFSQGSPYLDNSFDGREQDGSRRSSDLPVFDLSTIAEATDNFSSDNKLGEGGFGSVYKGLLHNGREIAVKRLSRSSGQGIQEFKNEVSLIARLQHRNLVSILGCCIEAQEKMLIYEYLPNKSLDLLIFDETKRSLLDWSKRFEIVHGIARGILYLHQDSRLRIIHRDLKASNVLLDDSMTPKISDFGMARIFGVDQIEASTNRVVGTYGYMSPEYAMEGLFSVKSDVYSFGILLLEIITGRKKSAFHLEEGAASSNLVGYIWDLWKEGKAMEIVDKSLGLVEPYPAHEILRCIQIGLLCVQEQATDRPTMSTVVFMLGNDNELPSPQRPAFTGKRTSNADDIWPSEGVSSSVNEVTITFQCR